MLGPTLGGLMLSWFWWGSVFLLAVPVMAVLLVAGPFLLPEYRNPEAGRLDLPSVGLSLAAIIPVIYGLKELARGGWAALPVAALIGGAVFALLFVRRQRRLADPLLDLALFKIRVYRSAVLLGLLIGVVAGGALMLINIQLQMVEGLVPLAAGLWLVPSAVSTIAVIMVSPALARKVRPAYVIAGGLAASGVGYVVLALVPSGGGLAMVVAGSVLTALGLGPTVALGYGMILGAVPPEKAGSASGLSESSGEFGLALGIALLGSIGGIVYRDRISLPAGLPRDAASAAVESIANAAAVARHLSATAADALIASARAAFTDGFHLVSVLAAILFAVLAVIAVLWFRHVPKAAD